MRKTMAFFAAVVLMAIGFIFTSGVSDAYAKTALLGNVSMSMAPNGPYGSWEFTGQPSFGGGVWFGMSNRVSFRLDYMGQGMDKPGWEYDYTMSFKGIDIIPLAKDAYKDISGFNVKPEDLMQYTTQTESGNRHMVTGTLYISFTPENGSRLVVEPVLGLIAGFAATQHRTDVSYYYHPVIEYVFPGSMDPQSGFLMTGDDGSHHSQKSTLETRPVGGASFGLNIYPTEHFIIAPEIRWLAGYGANARIGTGVAF